MPNGAHPGSLHLVVTQRSGYQYFFYTKHHQPNNTTDAQWEPTVTQDEEFAVFDLADQHDLSEANGDLFGLHLGPGPSILLLGTRGEQVAEFPVTVAGQAWHGYPLFPIAEKSLEGREANMSARFINVEQMGVNGRLVSWAGKCPWTNGICFGTNEGTLEFPPDLMAEASLNTGAINAVAFSGELVALSSPSEVTIFARTSKERLRLERLAHSFEGGAHNIVAAAPGVFLATLGDDGLLSLKAETNQTITARVGRQVSAAKYFYKVVPFFKSPESELLLCAARRDGLLVIAAQNGIPRPPVIGYRFGTHDIIDVCPLNHPKHPHAAVCLSRSGGLVVIPDTLSNEQPYEVRFENIRGTGYALAAARDHLFLLTSEAFICFPGVISRMLQQAPLNAMDTPILPISASDMYLIGEHSICLLTDGGVRRIKVEELVGGTPTATSPFAGGEIKQEPFGVQMSQPICNSLASQRHSLGLTLEDPVPV
jgi:hypothetical protein